jgi:hypothetical protein
MFLCHVLLTCILCTSIQLFEVVSNPDLAKIISWMPHGRAFVVKDPDALVRDVLPIYFSQTKFLSFVRQLNLWGFKRLTRGVQGKAYVSGGFDTPNFLCYC